MAKRLVLPHNPAYESGYVLGYAEYGEKITPRLLEYTRASGDYNDVGDYFDVDEPTITSDGYVMANIQRTNLLTRSNDFTNVDWGKAAATVDPSQRITWDAVSSTHLLFQTQPTVGGNNYSQYYDVTSDGLRFIQIYAAGGGFSTPNYANFDLINKTVSNNGFASASIKELPNGNLRINVVETSSATSSGVLGLSGIESFSDGYRPTFTGDGRSGLILHNSQLEVGSYPSTYIPTEASAVTRAAANAGASFQVVDVSNGGTFIIKCKAQDLNDGGSTGPIMSVRQDGSNYIGPVVNDTNWRLRITAGGNTPALSSSPVPNTEDVCLGVTWDSTGFSYWANGERFLIDTVTDITSDLTELSYTAFSIDESRGGLGFKSMVIYDERLSEAEMAKATRL